MFVYPPLLTSLMDTEASTNTLNSLDITYTAGVIWKQQQVIYVIYQSVRGVE